MEPVALDANVVIGYIEPTDALHEEAVQRISELVTPGRPVTMSTLAYAEASVYPELTGQAHVVEEFVHRARVELVDVDRTIAREAVKLRARFGLQLADCVIIASALARNALLITFDQQARVAWDRSR